jgi:uncharacterized protein
MPRLIETHLLDGPAGRLESLLEEPEDRAPAYAAIICHPHPLYGGTLHNKVVYRLARGLRRTGAVALRFNFRGVGRSQGKHDHGAGEIEDARAALEWLRARYPGLPFVLAGFSFGSRVALRLGCEGGAQPLEVIAAGFPTSREGYEYLYRCTVSKTFIQSIHDEHAPKPDFEALFRDVASPKRLEWVEAADHFFRDALNDFEDRVFRLGSGLAEVALDPSSGP